MSKLNVVTPRKDLYDSIQGDTEIYPDFELTDEVIPGLLVWPLEEERLVLVRLRLKDRREHENRVFGRFDIKAAAEFSDAVPEVDGKLIT